MNPGLQYLLTKALEARQNSYSPYSKYKVGAAVRAKSGAVYVGTNVENKSYGITICAERSAIFSAIANGEAPESLIELAVVTQDGGTSCGACRQVLVEINPQMLVYFFSLRVEGYNRFKAIDLLPNPF